jgi:hydroxymethylbilane synthase
VGGKGLFVKEIEEALLGNLIDIAVHSMKDMPAELPDGLVIGAVPERENPMDVLIAKTGADLETLPEKAKVGTSSLRRKAQLKHLRPDIRVEPLRGNLDTRLRKLVETDLEAVVVAAAGVKRLGLSRRITAYIPTAHMLPAVGQGALCIEQRDEDPDITPIIAALDHQDTRTAVMAERAFLHRLEGSCQVPIAALGALDGHRLSLTGRVSDPEGKRMIVADIQGERKDAVALGCRLADDLLNRGADEILERLKHHV